jgi:hypothetical protein
VDRRIGIDAIPSDPKSYLNEQQQLGLIHLREYGWRTFCVRRLSGGSATTILRNRFNQKLGILSENGMLRLVEHLKLRDSSRDESHNIEKMVKSINYHLKKDPHK